MVEKYCGIALCLEEPEASHDFEILALNVPSAPSLPHLQEEENRLKYQKKLPKYYRDMKKYLPPTNNLPARDNNRRHYCHDK